MSLNEISFAAFVAHITACKCELKAIQKTFPNYPNTDRQAILENQIPIMEEKAKALAEIL